jgi:protoporphyrinogen oxidase
VREDTDVVVLGAGPAGLTAAWQAARRGLSVTLLERQSQPGGMAATVTVDGVAVDRGSHRLHPATPSHILEDLRGLLGADLQTRQRRGRLRLYGQWVDFPLRAAELARAVPPGAVARIGRDAALAPLRARRAAGHPSDASYASVLTGSLGPELYQAMYAPYALKLWGLPGEQIDAEQARVRVTADTPWKVAARVLRGSSGGNGQGRVFHYPRRGFGQLSEALAAAGVEAGVDLRTATDVTGVHIADGNAGRHHRHRRRPAGRARAVHPSAAAACPAGRPTRPGRGRSLRQRGSGSGRWCSCTSSTSAVGGPATTPTTFRARRRR